MNDINEPLYEKINRWLDVLNECSEPVKPDDDIIYKGGDNE